MDWWAARGAGSLNHLFPAGEQLGGSWAPRLSHVEASRRGHGEMLLQACSPSCFGWKAGSICGGPRFRTKQPYTELLLLSVFTAGNKNAFQEAFFPSA